jgi:hypothetical protein
MAGAEGACAGHLASRSTTCKTRTTTRRRKWALSLNESSTERALHLPGLAGPKMLVASELAWLVKAWYGLLCFRSVRVQFQFGVCSVLGWVRLQWPDARSEWPRNTSRVYKEHFCGTFKIWLSIPFLLQIFAVLGHMLATIFYTHAFVCHFEQLIF